MHQETWSFTLWHLLLFSSWKYFGRFCLYFCWTVVCLYFCWTVVLLEHLLSQKRKCERVFLWTFKLGRDSCVLPELPLPPPFLSAGSELLGERLSWEEVAEREQNTWCFYAKMGREPGLLEFQWNFPKFEEYVVFLLTMSGYK